MTGKVQGVRVEDWGISVMDYREVTPFIGVWSRNENDVKE